MRIFDMLKTSQNFHSIKNPFIFSNNKKIFLIDNASYNYINNPAQGIPVLPYYGGEKNMSKYDTELNKLLDYLMCLSQADKKGLDMVELNRLQFRHGEVMRCENVHKALDVMLK